MLQIQSFLEHEKAESAIKGQFPQSVKTNAPLFVMGNGNIRKISKIHSESVTPKKELVSFSLRNKSLEYCV